MMQGIWPRNQRPVKLVMGVRGAAVRHITMSDTAMLHTNRFMPVCSAGVLETEKNGCSTKTNGHYVNNLKLKKLLKLIFELCFKSCHFFSFLTRNNVNKVNVYLITVIRMKTFPSIPMRDTIP